jgi:amidophosphoribosyltransferase
MCGIIGIENTNDSALLALSGLLALQHRGEESAGITVSNANGLKTWRAMGLVGQLFEVQKLKDMEGFSAIAHVRYSTSSGSALNNAQPFCAASKYGDIAIAHNGNITNFDELKSGLLNKGVIFNHGSDTEIILHLTALSNEKNFTSAVSASLKVLKGAFSLVLLCGKTLIGARDPNGFRPLALGKIKDSYMLASETCAIDSAGGVFIREIEPGEIIEIENGKIKSSIKYSASAQQRTCIFEQVYFSRPDSLAFSKTVKDARIEMGRLLARQMQDIINESDVVVPVPESGYYAAMGFSHEANLDFDMAIIKNHYVGRSFIKPSQKLRAITADLKLSPIKESVNAKRIILIDDSMVRGTTAKIIVSKLRRSGVKKIHLALASPPIIAPCFYGINTPLKNNLIASAYSVEQIRKSLELDTLTFLDIKSLVAACGGGENCFCRACFTGDYLEGG